MPHSLPIIPLLSDTLQSHKHYKSSNSTLCLFFLQFPLSSVQTLFPSLCSQTEPAYKWQIALRSLTSLFLCYTYHTFPYNPYYWQTSVGSLHILVQWFSCTKVSTFCRYTSLSIHISVYYNYSSTFISFSYYKLFFIGFPWICFIRSKYFLCKMFVVFEFLICDTLLCAKAISILVPRFSQHFLYQSLGPVYTALLICP